MKRFVLKRLLERKRFGPVACWQTKTGRGWVPERSASDGFIKTKRFGLLGVKRFSPNRRETTKRFGLELV